MRATLLLLGCLTGCSPPEVVVRADSGFRPARDGFAFANYGNSPSVENLGPDEMRRLFGNDALRPEAAAWMEARNAEMIYGHCEGMAVLALILFQKLAAPAEFGAPSTVELAFDGTRLQREIAYWFVTQVTEPVRSAERRLSPSEVVRELGRAPADYTVGVYRPDGSGGHTLTPFSVEAKSDGSATIGVYDPNAPGTARAITVDGEGWRYEVAALGRTPARRLEGDAQSRTLTLLPLSARLEPQQCPFCGDPPPPAPRD